YGNGRHGWNWAISLEQVPYRVDFLQVSAPAGSDTVQLSEVTQRQASRGIFGIAAYPLNTATRIEYSGGARQLTFTQQVTTGIYDAHTGVLQSRTQSDRADLAAPM